MKKILTFALAAVAAMSSVSCIKGNDSWSEMQSVMPGVTIYQMAMNQNVISLLPANAGMRVAMLVSEALSQDPDYDLANLSQVTSSNRKVLSALFNSMTTVVPVDGVGYRVTFSDGAEQAFGLILSGSMLVRTNGVVSLADGGMWTVEMENVTVSTSSSSSTSSSTTKLVLDGGTTSLTCDGNGSFSVEARNFRTHFEGASIYSNWSGSFLVKAPDASLTYSGCAGETFDVTGSASGPTMYTADEIFNTPLTIDYTLDNGVYSRMQIVEGTQTCQLTNSSEYSPTIFPSSTVVYEWTLSGNTYSYKISYNGAVYPN